MKNKRYRQKYEIAYLVLNSMGSGPVIPSRMCVLANTNRETLHEYLNAFLKLHLVSKNTVPNIYDGKVREYSLTATGRLFMADLKDINKRLAWIYSI